MNRFKKLRCRICIFKTKNVYTYYTILEVIVVIICFPNLFLKNLPKHTILAHPQHLPGQLSIQQHHIACYTSENIVVLFKIRKNASCTAL